MVLERVRFMIIGCGIQAQKLYLPAINQLKADGYDVTLEAVVDTEESRRRIISQLNSHGFCNETVVYTPVNARPLCVENLLDLETSSKLTELVKKTKINSVILGTDPISRIAYLDWAQKSGLNIFSEKPVSARSFASTDFRKALLMLEDYEQMRLRRGSYVFFVNLQRRYQSAYHHLAAVIRDVYKKTNCPLTSIQIIEDDGHWRLPYEYFIPMTHSMIEGIGKLTFSGFHYIDIACFLARQAERSDLRINNAVLHANAIRAYDTSKVVDTKVA